MKYDQYVKSTEPEDADKWDTCCLICNDNHEESLYDRMFKYTKNKNL